MLRSGSQWGLHAMFSSESAAKPDVQIGTAHRRIGETSCQVATLLISWVGRVGRAVQQLMKTGFRVMFVTQTMLATVRLLLLGQAYSQFSLVNCDGLPTRCGAVPVCMLTCQELLEGLYLELTGDMLTCSLTNNVGIAATLSEKS